MNVHELNEAVGLIDDRHLDRAERTKPRAKRVGLARWTGLAAAVLAIAILLTTLPGKRSSLTAYALREAVYPEMARYPEGESLPGFREKNEKWHADLRRQRAFYGAGTGLDPFFRATVPAFLDGAEGENRVYSPLSVYLALAMLAEITEGESRGQVLALLGSRDMESLRTQAHAVWNANYRDDGAVVSILGNSLWMNEDLRGKQAALDTLAADYYASSYQGKMGSADFSRAYRDWIDAQTGGLLTEQLKDKKLDEELLLALVSTICFRAKWNTAFSAAGTRQETFHTPGGDRETDFMHQTDTHGYYAWGNRFSATRLVLREQAGTLWFILPDEGCSPEELLRDEEAMDFLMGGDWGNSARLKVNLSLPKFDVQSRLDLQDTLRALGVTDVFSADTADFTPLLFAGQEAELSAAEHGARVAIDEAGVTAAAYTALQTVGASLPPEEEIDFVLDRPFLFLLTGPDDLPLFIGIVNAP